MMWKLAKNDSRIQKNMYQVKMIWQADTHKREKQGPLKKAYLFFLQHCSIIER